jgi:hypothetical protein
MPAIVFLPPSQPPHHGGSRSGRCVFVSFRLVGPSEDSEGYAARPSHWAIGQCVTRTQRAEP